MSVFLATPHGPVRQINGERWLLSLPCGHDELLNLEQWHGRLSVNHAATGCSSGWHETIDFAAVAEPDRFAEGNREADVCQKCGQPIWRVFHGPNANHTIEPRRGEE